MRERDSQTLMSRLKTKEALLGNRGMSGLQKQLHPLGCQGHRLVHTGLSDGARDAPLHIRGGMQEEPGKVGQWSVGLLSLHFQMNLNGGHSLQSKEIPRAVQVSPATIAES